MRHFGVPSLFITGRFRLGERRGEGAVPEDLLGDVALSRHRAGFEEVHAGGFRRRVFLQPLDELGQGIHGRRTIGVATAADRGADRYAVLGADAPFVDRSAIRKPAIAVAGHREPGVGEAPAQRRVLLAVVHVAIDFLAINFLHGVGEEVGDVFVGRPIDRHAEFVAELGLECGLELGLLEPVVAEPVEVRELLVRQLVELAVGERAEGKPDEVVEVEVRIGDVLAVPSHEVGQRSADDVVVARMRADEVGIVHPEVVDRLAGLNFDRDLVDEQTLVHHLMVDLMPVISAKALVRVLDSYSWMLRISETVLTFIPLNGADALMNHSISAIC